MSPKPPVWAYSLPTALLLMAPFYILASLAMDIYLPIVPAMPGILGTGPAIVQLTLSLYMVMLGLGQIIFGPISDRIGRRPVLIGGAILFAAASFGLAASSTAGSFVVLRFLQAVGASAAMVATFATVRDVYADRPESTEGQSREELLRRWGLSPCALPGEAERGADVRRGAVDLGARPDDPVSGAAW